jgi:hypothetical protein
MFAKYGHAAYCRQTLIGGNYGLLEKVGSQDFGSKISERSLKEFLSTLKSSF